MPFIRSGSLAFVALVLAASSGARADLMFAATLTHDQETSQGIFLTSSGAPRPESFGTATFVLNSAETELTMFVEIFHIDVTGLQTPDDTNDNLLAAHIHVGAPPGSNAGVAWGFFGAPDNDNNPDDLVVTPFASGVGGQFTSKWDLLEGNIGTTLSTHLPSIKAGLAYINFHTAQFPGGEIRGQLSIVPEPSSAVLLGLGAALGTLVWRRRLGSPSVSE